MTDPWEFDLNALPSRLRPYRRLALDLLLVAVVAVLVVGAVLLLNSWFTDAAAAGLLGVVASVVQSFITAVIVAVGAVFAYRKLQLFRDFEPHLTVTQTLSHRPIGTRYVHISVTAILQNSSKVRVEIREAFYKLYQIAPIDDDEIELLYNQTVVNRDDDDVSDIHWPELEALPRASDTHVLTIEPGETHYETGEFIISRDVRTVLLYSYFFNSEYFEHSHSAPGWTATTIYDIVIDQRSAER